MATQGLISIIKGGKVVAKIITGCDGRNVVALAEELRKDPCTDMATLFCLAKQQDLGGDSLVVQTSPSEWMCDGDLEELPDLYREKFHVPDFNPRWERGTADYTEIVDLGSGNAELTGRRGPVR